MTGCALSLRGISISRADVPVVHDVSLDVEAAAVTVLLGANGAGKTTLMDGIAGLAKASSGSVELDGRPIGKLPTFRRARAGLAYVEQSRTVFRSLTVEQNLLVSRSGDGDLDTVYRLFPELDRRRKLAAGHLSGGEQQMVVLGRALIASPRIVLIDEMSSGLAPVVVQRLMRGVTDLVGLGISVLLIEQFAHLALAIGSRAYVLRKGRVVFDGPCADLRDGGNDLLHDLYFGSATDPDDGVPDGTTGRTGTTGTTGRTGTATAAAPAGARGHEPTAGAVKAAGPAGTTKGRETS